ncbi:MAG: GGDEF domain-containing protein [Lachnospiraceae bacterium]|nr:GGDEF domain-containing protein [Lachnospiraceae bacterium]
MGEANKRKKKVAVFVNGWNAENVYRYLDGLSKHTPDFSIDYYIFVCHAIYSSSDTEIKSMSTIFDLPDLRTFDAAIMFVPGLNFTEVINQLITKLERSGIPVLSIGMQHPGFHYIGVNNYTGMRQLCDHLIEEHNMRDVIFIAGSRENEDSNNRLIALRDSMRSHDLPFSDSNIYYSNWEIGMVMYEFGARIRNGMKLPDAFVCANDQLAETISYVLTDNGLPIDSVIVTGFDFLEEAQNFYPSIASVDQRYEAVAELSVEALQNLFRGEEVPEEQLVDCVFHPGESCGCLTCRNDDLRRRSVARNIPRKFMTSDIVDGRFHAMEKEIIQSVDYEDLKEKLHKLFCNTIGQEGDTFYIMLDPHIVDFSLSDMENYPQHHFADVMDTFVAKRNGQPITGGVIPTSQLLPDDDPAGPNHFYFFVPTYFESYVCGYIVITDRLDWMPNKFFHLCESRFNRAIVSYRRNMQLTALNTKLSMLMEKDSLTFVKNRTAYDRYIKKMETQMLSGDFEPFAVVCFDINNLKPVNDELGHEAGDEYIKKCCKLICNTFKHSPVFRIGGDEFVAIAVHDDYQQRFEYLQAMRMRMEELRNDTTISPIDRISVASGMADCNEHVGDDYSAIFRRADTRMYDNKRMMKADMR